MKSCKPGILILFPMFFLFLAGCAAATPVPAGGGFEATEAPTQAPPSTENPPASGTDISSVEFNSSSLESVPPKDVLKEVYYYGGGGWGESECPNQDLQIFRNDDIHTEPGCTIAMYACGWQDNEDVSITTIYPDGRQISSTAQASPNPSTLTHNQNPLVEVSYGLDVADPAGDYTFVLEGSSGRVEHQVKVFEADGARVYLDSDGVLLKGFSAGERIRFFVYKLVASGNATLTGWVEFQVDDHGDKRIMIDDPQIRDGFLRDYFYVVVGDRAGQLYPLEPITCQDHTFGYLDPIVRSTSSEICGKMQSRLSNGQSASVAFTDGTEMRVRAIPGLSGNVVQKVPEGTRFRILDGPQCVDEISWWRVQTTDGVEGWMAEYSNGVYLLEP